MKSVWISAYLYHDDSPEPFLIQEVKPFVDKLLKKKLIESFFFIRYWTHGGHVRLRLRTPRKNVRNVRRKLLDNFSNIRFVHYRPELERYGNKIAIKIAERQFNLSSDVVLSFLSNERNWEYEQRLGKALEMMYLLYQAGLTDNKKVSQFLKDYRFKPEEVKKYKPCYIKQKEDLLNYFERLKNDKIFETEAPSWMIKWQEEMRSICKDLKKLISHQGRYLGILHSYVHMNNNRLGITRSDEQFSAYLLKMTVDETSN